MQEDAPNFIASHWRGDYPLGQAFWLHTVLIPGMLFGVTAWSFYSAANTGGGSLVFPCILFAVLLVVSVWAMGGAWKSATQHEARGGQARWKNWALAALLLNAALLALATVPISFVFLAFALAGGRV